MLPRYAPASGSKFIHKVTYYTVRRKIEASPDQNGYDTASFRKMKVHFDSIPHSFSIMKKRAISIIAGDGSHFISYLAVNFGAHFQEEISTNRDSTFIANIDSGDGSANRTLSFDGCYNLQVRGMGNSVLEHVGA